ncbi:MAG: glucokinase [Rhodospirillales bacterium]|nr:glucokinase [Rhodospirillales bacterium]
MTAHAGLIADIGGTNARFAVLDADGRYTEPVVLPCKNFETPAKAVQAFATQAELAALPAQAAVSIAGPVRAGRVEMTNHIWRLNADELARDLGIGNVRMINDFEAIALGIPDLGSSDAISIQDGDGDATGPIAVMGPGTGLGASILIPSPTGRIAVATEGGHATLAPRTDRELEVMQVLAKRFGHVSWERVLSGPGLEALHETLGGEAVDAGEVTRRMQTGDGTALDTYALFFTFLGTAASDLALTCGATGGVYFAGGILPRLGQELAASGLKERFADKGRFGDYLSHVPVKLITHPYPAFVGLSYLVNNSAPD